MSLEKIEQKNIDRAASLVVRINRAIERNTNDLFKVGNEMQAEQTRHIRAMDDLRERQRELEAGKKVLEEELKDAKEYLTELTKVTAK